MRPVGALALVVGLSSCLPTGSTAAWPELSGLAAAAFVEVDAAAAVTRVVALPVEDGRLSESVLGRRDGDSFFLVVVHASEIPLVRLDLDRVDEAKIVLGPRASCGGDGEIENARISYGLGSRGVVFGYESDGFVELSDPGIELRAWLSDLRVELAVRENVGCEAPPSWSLYPSFEHGSPVLPTDRVGGMEVGLDGVETTSVQLISDGRIAASTARFIVLREPDAPLVDDPAQLMDIYQPRPADPLTIQGELHLARDDGTGHGELWFISDGADRFPQLESVSFSPVGLGERRVLSTIPSEAEILRFIVDPADGLLARSRDGGLWYARSATGTWTLHHSSRAEARSLVPVPGRPRTYLAAEAEGALLLELPAAEEVGGSLRSATLGEPFEAVRWVNGGFAVLGRGGQLEMGVSGTDGFVALFHDLETLPRWERLEIDVPFGIGGGCLPAMDCGRTRLSDHVWDILQIEYEGEAWLLLALDDCVQILAVRLRDGCTAVSAIHWDLPALRDIGSGRRFLEREGRLFLTQSNGPVFELTHD